MCIKVIILVSSVVLVANCNLVPYLRKCKTEDPQCIKESSQSILSKFVSGIPEANVETLDPMKIKHVDANTPNLKFMVSDLVITGLKNCEVKRMQVDRSRGKLLVKIMCPCIFDAKYNMKGQLFVLPIEGTGGLRAVIKKILINVDADITEKIGRDGKNHWSIKGWTHTFELKEKSDVKFENLFPNNELLRKATEELIANNGNDVITEIGPPILNAVIGKIVENVGKFFQAIPLEDLIL